MVFNVHLGKVALALSSSQNKPGAGILQVRLKERAKQTKEIVIEQLQAEEAAAQAMREGPKEMGDIDTDDEKYQDTEYAQWTKREYGRIRYG